VDKEDTMPRIGVTGHARLSAEIEAVMLDALTAALHEFGGRNLHGVTCLARGADQLFARAVLAAHGTLEVVLPARDYREQMIGSDGRAMFDKLLDQATEVRTMPFARSNREAFLAASTSMLDMCDLLFAVWDGAPSREVGDTAHVVSVAQDRQIPVMVFWPNGANT
jgi:hypothetical protein